MKLITTVNGDINKFLSSSVDSLMLGLKDYVTYLDVEFTMEEIEKITKRKNNKEIYVLVNRIIEQDEIEILRDILKRLATLNIDGIVVMDMGLLEIAKKENILDKIVFSPSTYLTNKDSAAYLSSLGVKRLVLSKEISLNNIFEIKKNVTCDIEVTAYGYRNIFYSKRHIKTMYRDHYNVDDFSYLKEEKREDLLFPIEETNKGTFVFSAHKLSLWSYLKKMLDNNVDYLNIESNFIDFDELNDVINKYKYAIDLYGSDKFEEYIKNITFNDCDEGFINRDSVYMQEEY